MRQVSSNPLCKTIFWTGRNEDEMPYVPKQYDSAKDFLGSESLHLGNITDPMDSMRLLAYNLYDDLYSNRPDSYRVALRTDSDVEIYLPSTSKIVDATARFLAVDFDFQVKGGENLTGVEKLLRDTWKREAIANRSIKGKKSMLTRGDLLWHVTADPRKEVGKRLSLNTIHPSSYFPIEDPENAMRVIGCHLVDLVADPREATKSTNKLVARRQTYRKEPNGQISSEAMTFELGAWDDRSLAADKLKPVSIIWPKKLLPPQIKTIPIYHFPNNEPDGSSWGMSQVAGIEYIINALNQSITYEDLTLTLQGLGVYVSTAGPPKDEGGNPGVYKLHPGNVVEISQGDEFSRVSGVSSVSPWQDHLSFLDAWALQGSGIPEMATGTVDVSVAQSGIALALKMGPIIAENADKQLTIGGKWEQLGYDLIHGWLPAFEGVDSPATIFTPTFGDPMPLDRDAYVKELIELYSSGLLLIDEVREKLEKIGYKYSSDLTEKLLEETNKKATAEMGEPKPDELGADAPDLMDTLAGTNGSKKTMKLVT